MESEVENAALYTLRVEGSILPLNDRDFTTNVLARATEGEMESSLVLLTPEQVEKLHDFLRVHDVTPAVNGIYVGHNGIWNVVKDGAVVQTGQWRIPNDVLTSLQSAGSRQEAGASAMSAKAPSGAGERDPVCGMNITPGLEAANVVYKEHTYHFCSVECRDLFRENPTRYVQSLVGAS